MRIGVWLQELTPLLANIVMQVLQRETDFEVVEIEIRPVSKDADQQALDVLVLGLGDAGDVERWRGLLFDPPPVRLLGIAGDGSNGWIYELRPHREALGNVSPAELIAAVRRPRAGG